MKPDFLKKMCLHNILLFVSKIGVFGHFLEIDSLDFANFAYNDRQEWLLAEPCSSSFQKKYYLTPYICTRIDIILSCIFFTIGNIVTSIHIWLALIIRILNAFLIDTLIINCWRIRACNVFCCCENCYLSVTEWRGGANNAGNFMCVQITWYHYHAMKLIDSCED